MTSSSPGVASVFMPNAYYPTHEAYIEALGAAMQEEYEAIVDAGFVLQVDCPDLAMAFHTGFQGLSEGEFLRRVEHHIEVLNGALENVPAESARLHVCWGNYEGPHDHDIAVSKIMPILLRAKPSAILFEASNPRHAHEWTDWRDAKVPDDKVLIPGVLDSTSNFVEHPELVAQRIETFAAIVGRERVLAGSDCGFWDVRRLREDGPGHRLSQVGGDGGRGGHRLQAPLGLRLRSGYPHPSPLPLVGRGGQASAMPSAGRCGR